MKTQDFDFQLPEELIAKHPLASRSDSRLLHLNRATADIEHRQFRDLRQLLRKGDLLVFNDTRVIPARLYGRKESGGRLEALIERVVEDRVLLVQLRVSKSPQADTSLWFEPHQGREDLAPLEAKVLGRRGEFFEIRFLSEQPLTELLQNYGHVPLPPYIDRQDDTADRDRYQTVYARTDGAVAAPTAGLHFDEDLLQALEEQGVEQAFVTLHVGAGTFQPVRVDDVSAHKMHSEWFEMPQSTVAAVERCRERGGRVVAVGTTSVRTLESSVRDGKLEAQTGETDIFIYPGFKFQVVDALITNFHLPQSTLLMLISALADKKMILDAYEEAVTQRYRFFSYGDAMLIS